MSRSMLSFILQASQPRLPAKVLNLFTYINDKGRDQLRGARNTRKEGPLSAALSLADSDRWAECSLGGQGYVAASCLLSVKLQKYLIH